MKSLDRSSEIAFLGIDCGSNLGIIVLVGIQN